MFPLAGATLFVLKGGVVLRPSNLGSALFFFSLLGRGIGYEGEDWEERREEWGGGAEEYNINFGDAFVAFAP